MKRYGLRRFIDSRGEETYVLMEPVGLPSYWPNYYVISSLRSQGLSPKTIRNHLIAIARASDWMFAMEGTDFSTRMMTGEPLSYDEAEALGDFLRLTAQAQNTELTMMAEARKKPLRPNVIGLEAARPNRRRTNRERHEEIQDEGYAAALRNTASFLEWTYNARKTPIRFKDFGSDRRIFAEEGLKRLKSFIPRLTDKGDQDESLEGLSRQFVQIIEDIVTPCSADNPWKDAFVRDRNYLIWKLFLETGGRRAEVHNILVANLQLSGANVSFHVSKTLRRTVPFRPATRILIDEFITQHWSKLPKWARKKGYLFTGRDGRQLSERQVNRIFEDIRASSAAIPKYLTPHTMRRTWNEFLSEMLDASKEAPDSEMERKIRNRLMGWSEASTSADKYLRRHTRKKADEIAEKLFDEIETVTNPKSEIEIANDD
ncbi:site-specific integrase [Nisaea sp.]|uniref:tyrosine-type recombinase/integrase n=1 Tax=Nisaea sp. TaxID=2024842 RepID=UPI002B26AD27|nr:site-specific integrase [Nisaea sp.]